jgi:glycosyltransferase involved in cell wall biosynthesis
LRGRAEVRVNTPFEELRSWYARASIFWHACGLGERDPQLIEHFGMTVVEAMQNRCAPVVFDGGGLREIVEHAKSGLLFSGLEDLCASTIRLLRSEKLRLSIQENAELRSARFGRAAFDERVCAFFALVEREYAKMPAPSGE